MTGPSSVEQLGPLQPAEQDARQTSERSSDGPATVLNSRTLRKSELTREGTPTGVDSDLHRRLFPSETSSHEFTAVPDVAGCEIDHFRIEEMIGRGGMGAVFRAYDQRLDRIIALKILSPGLSRDSATVERFRNEAKAAARLDHENVARVYFSGEDRGVNFIAFEFVTGTNLRELIRKNGRLSPEEAVSFTLQIAAALRHTSSAGVVHRDIKPSNIIISPSGRAKLVDLGLARKESSESSPDLTVAGTTLGTFDYISPEQAKDPRNVDVRSDIYSLGCTLYHMLTGEPPFPDGTFVQKLLDRQDKAPPDPVLKAPRVSPELSAVVQKMMAMQPRLRHADADELINDLMVIAGKLGLRGVHPEGLVWTHLSRLTRSRFLERNLGWIVTAMILGVVIFAVDRFSRTDNGIRTGARLGSNGTHGRVLPVGISQTSGRTISKVNPTPDGLNSVTKRGKANTNSVGKPTPLIVNLDRDFQQALVTATGVIGASAFGKAFSSTDSGTHRKSTAASPGGTPTSPGTRKKDVQSPNAKPAAIAIRGSEGTYTTLESACATADDGQVILLSFHGIRKDAGGNPIVDRPLRIVDKSITIRAAEGYFPVLSFAGEKVPSRGAQTCMVTLSNATLNVFGVGFQLQVNDRIDADNDARWAVFSLQGAEDSIVLRGVHVTVRNPKNRSASIFEVVPRTGPDLAKMKMMKKTGAMAADRFEITVSESLLRGDCDVLSVADPRPGLFDVEKTVIVAGKSLMSVTPDTSGETVPETSYVELKLDHVTCITGGAVIDLAIGDMPGLVLPIRTRSQDNLFVSTSGKPFTRMSGRGQIRDFRKLLRWKGEKNFYHGFQTMWLMNSDDPMTKPLAEKFTDWQTFWGALEVDASVDGVVWKREWTSKSATDILPVDLQLEMSSDTGDRSAADGATDGKAVGADMLAISQRMGISTNSSPR